MGRRVDPGRGAGGGAGVSVEVEGAPLDLVIHRGRVVDGTGRPAFGAVRHVVVNGVPVLVDAKLTGQKPGEVIL